MGFAKLYTRFFLALFFIYSAIPAHADTTIMSERCGDKAEDTIAWVYYLTDNPRQAFAKLAHGELEVVLEELIKNARPEDTVAADIETWSLDNRSYLNFQQGPSNVGNPCTLTLQIEGSISQLDLDIIRSALDRYSRPPFIIAYLNSSGGEIYSALEIGRIFRRHYATVHVGNHSNFNSQPSTGCLSACVLIYASGVAKNIDPYVDGIGVHQSFLSRGHVEALSVEDGIRLLKENNEILGRYFEEMGVSQELLALSNSIPANQIRFLNEQELKIYLPFIVSEYAAILPIKIDQALSDFPHILFSSMDTAMTKVGPEQALLEYLRAWEEEMDANFERIRWAFYPRHYLEVGSWNQNNTIGLD